MANAFYANGKEHLLTCLVDWDTDAMDFELVDATDYTLDLANDDFFDDVTVGGREANFGPLLSKTSALGVADAADFSFLTVTGDECEYLILYEDTAVASTSGLVCNIDAATGLPITPNGANIDVVLNASGIFEI